jgi:hypothetical protein
MTSLVACCGVGDNVGLDLWTYIFGGTIPKEEKDHASCDPTHCAMKGGICIDCTKCTHHCTCDNEEEEASAVISRQCSVKEDDDTTSSQESGEEESAADTE